MRTITLQPAEYVDHITDDGTELTKLPYPFHVDAATGTIGRQDFWRGEPLRVIGFVSDLNRQEIDLWWEDATRDPQQAVGMYIVTQHTDNSMQTQITAVNRVEVHEDATPDPVDGSHRLPG